MNKKKIIILLLCIIGLLLVGVGTFFYFNNTKEIETKKRVVFSEDYHVERTIYDGTTYDDIVFYSDDFVLEGKEISNEDIVKAFKAAYNAFWKIECGGLLTNEKEEIYLEEDNEYGAMPYYYAEVEYQNYDDIKDYLSNMFDEEACDYLNKDFVIIDNVLYGMEYGKGNPNSVLLEYDPIIKRVSDTRYDIICIESFFGNYYYFISYSLNYDEEKDCWRFSSMLEDNNIDYNEEEVKKELSDKLLTDLTNEKEVEIYCSNIYHDEEIDETYLKDQDNSELFINFGDIIYIKANRLYNNILYGFECDKDITISKKVKVDGKERDIVYFKSKDNIKYEDFISNLNRVFTKKMVNKLMNNDCPRIIEGPDGICYSNICGNYNDPTYWNCGGYIDFVIMKDAAYCIAGKEKDFIPVETENYNGQTIKLMLYKEIHKLRYEDGLWKFDEFNSLEKPGKQELTYYVQEEISDEIIK